MQPQVPAYVYADDPILQAGVVSQLRTRPEIDIVDASDLGRAQVGVIVADSLDEETLRVCVRCAGGVEHIVLVMRSIDDSAGW